MRYLLLALVFVLPAMGCANTPPEKIQAALVLIDEGAQDYVPFAQALITLHIRDLEEAIVAADAAGDLEKSRELTAHLLEARQYQEAGAEIVPTLSMLRAWGEGQELPEEGAPTR